MKIEQHEYSDEADKVKMAALANAFPADNMHVWDLPYRFSSWAFDNPDNIRLWVNTEGRLAAWAVMQTPFWTIDSACHPDVETFVYQEILEWADNRARKVAGTPYGRPAWYFNVFSGQTNRIHDLEEVGFASQANVDLDPWSKVLMQREGQDPVKIYPLPVGFVIRPLAGENEVGAYVELHRSVFESKSMTVEWRTRTLRHPDYQPNLDLVVAAPDGRLAAFCIGWFNNHPGHEPGGRIEPLGCHKDFRRYALGRVALVEVLNRLRSCGADKIVVETDNFRNTAFALYQSVGFSVIQDVLVYRKDYADPQHSPAL